MTAPGAVESLDRQIARPRRAAASSRWFLPSLGDALFVALLSVLFLSGGWSHLLADGETGTHIRTGDFILQTHTIPSHDLYYFTLPEAPWYAWEWLSDVLFSAAHTALGLKGVVLLSGTVICFALLLLFRFMIWRGADFLLSAALTIVAADALKFHFLARPLIFTTLLCVVTLWVLHSDWKCPRRRLWFLIPTAAIWANLHGGFLVLLVAAGLYAVGGVLAGDWGRTLRYGWLTLGCAAATLVNPYGWQLHTHIWRYLRSDWLAKYVQEFQAPVFQGESMLKAEILLFLGLIAVADLIRRRNYPEALLIVLWAHAALASSRHLTIYVIVAVPAIADQLTLIWRNWSAAQSPRSAAGALRDLLADLHGPATRVTPWPAVVILVLAMSRYAGWPTDFPSNFPTAMVARQAAALSGADGRSGGILNEDVWGGYLAYRFYPNRRVYVDGRSDYFGPSVADEYIKLRSARDGWEDIVQRRDFRFVLIPPEWNLARELARRADWKLLDRDETALLFEHTPQP